MFCVGGESEAGGRDGENSDSEDDGGNGEEEQKAKPNFAIIPNNTTPVPLGWPKVRHNNILHKKICTYMHTYFLIHFFYRRKL